jgi:uncharacterized repeat protein (TIGR01451 family)
MRLMPQLLLACILVLAAAASARAANTPSGTVVTNTATVDFELSGVSQISASGSTSFTVDNKVNAVVTRNADATVVPGSANQALSFVVTNLGNTTQRYALSIVSRVTDSFDMNNARVYRDNGTTSGFWDAGDTLYVDAGAFGDVVSGASLTVLVVADTPAAQTNGQAAVYDLVAAAVDAGGTTVTAATAGPNSAGVDAVFADTAGSAASDAARDGKHSASGTFTISDVVVTVNKAVAVSDQFGGVRPLPGATLRYTLTVSVSGSGNANGLIITDPVPANTTYTAGSLRLNGSPLTDSPDADAGELAGAPGTVTVRLGTLTAASPQQIIVFDVRID